MQLHDNWQANFAVALMRPEASAPSTLMDPCGRHSQRRFAVYRNNVIAGIIDALAESFPAARRIVGDEFFRAMAQSFAFQRPPSSPILLEYGGSFAEFVGVFAPASELPYLADVCKLERAWLEAYHAAEATPIDAEMLAGLSAQKLTQLRLLLHPSLRLIRSRFPVVTLWKTNIDGATALPLDLNRSEHAMIARPFADVEVREISQAAWAFVKALQAGHNLLDAAEAGFAWDDEFDLAETLHNILALGLCIGVTAAQADNCFAMRGNDAA